VQLVGRAEEDKAGVVVGMLDDDVQDFGEGGEGPPGLGLGMRSALQLSGRSVGTSGALATTKHGAEGPKRDRAVYVMMGLTGMSPCALASSVWDEAEAGWSAKVRAGRSTATEQDVSEIAEQDLCGSRV
jgi:hypothetical protein